MNSFFIILILIIIVLFCLKKSENYNPNINYRAMYSAQTGQRYDPGSRAYANVGGIVVPINEYRYPTRAMTPGEFDAYVLRVIKRPRYKPRRLSLENHVINAVVDLIRRGELNRNPSIDIREQAIWKLRESKNTNQKVSNALDWRIV